MTAAELVARRHALGLTQMQLAVQVHQSLSAVGHWEAGRRRVPLWLDSYLQMLEQKRERAEQSA
jgi:DNA-binding transcriptional regulator YiaG